MLKESALLTKITALCTQVSHRCLISNKKVCDGSAWISFKLVVYTLARHAFI